MSTSPTPSFVIEQPNISAAKVLRRLEALKLTQKDVAKKLGIDPGAVTRGLRSQTWLQTRITELCKILQADAVDLLDDVSPTNGLAVLERSCGTAGKTGFRVPEGTDIRMLKMGTKWNVYLVAPDSIEVKDGDFVMIQAKSGVRVGQAHADENSKDRWILTSGPDRRPVSFDKSKIQSIRLIISSLGGVWGQQ